VNVALVLHSHLPWLRRHGTHPVGEQWLFEASAEAYLPLVQLLERLAADGLRDLVTVGVTPVLAEQLDDPYLMRELHGWLGRRLVDLESTVSRYRAADRERLPPVWRDHWRRLTLLLARFEARESRTGLAAPLARLAGEGVIELLAGPATHAYLPLMDDAALLRAQLADGLATHERVFGGRVRGVWTPECAWRPAGPVGEVSLPPAEVRPDGTPVLVPGDVVLPGLDAFWSEAGATHLVLDGPTLATAAGHPPQDWASTGGFVQPPGGPLDVVDRPALAGDSELAVFGRNLPVSYAVWSPHGGYPADPWYRDFFRADWDGGFKSWRVSDRSSLDKHPYDPVMGRERAVAHAHEFVALLHRHLDTRPPDAVVVAAYDTELFGHWWHEGPIWLETVLRLLVADPVLRPTTLRDYLERHPPRRRLALPESSWGSGKGHASWVNERTRWVWQAVRRCEARWRALPADAPGRAVAWRQLALLQASDWPFLITRDQAAGYAAERVRGHVEDFEAACRGERLDELARRDDPAGIAVYEPGSLGRTIQTPW
jgi:1,4-alpha-glucan branching enzyme